ncbi:hypothetical protein ACFYQA_08540 [Streptomyces sp. NPDC005774]|uniref:hypothetical protein n=1 Tax=Streptomyces sp. NPDC005774 TaxID=3364728 RepID=UPI0036767B2A
MNAATTTEWGTAFAVGVAAFLPGALLILALDHTPTLAPARTAVARVWLAVALRISTIPTGDNR